MAGGTVLVGVEPRTGHIRGVAKPLELEERLATSAAITSRLGSCRRSTSWRDAALTSSPSKVHPSPKGPDYLKARRRGGRYVRLGSTNRRTERELGDELRRFGRGDALDGQPNPGPRLGSAGLPSGFRVVHEPDDASRRS
jgi:hypothetical protein